MIPPAPRIKAEAYALGFDLCGIATLGAAETAPHFDDWLARGFAGEMYYLRRWADRRRDPRLAARGMRSAVVVALDYGGAEPPGPVARYARGRDYHRVMRERLRALRAAIARLAGGPVRMRAFSDTGPILERDLARRAGLGWFGKNAMLINPERGSCFVIGGVLTELDLEPDAPFESEHCGTCTRCLDACPTRAFVGPKVLDATRCLSYLTIELRGDIPEALRAAVGERLFGCDVCQDVCPWNERFGRPARGPDFVASAFVGTKDARTLAAGILAMSDAALAAAVAESALARATPAGLRRNAAVVLANG